MVKSVTLASLGLLLTTAALGQHHMPGMDMAAPKPQPKPTRPQTAPADTTRRPAATMPGHDMAGMAADSSGGMMMGLRKTCR